MAMGDLLADEVERVLAENNLSVDVIIPVSVLLRSELEVPFTNTLWGTRYRTHRA